ncbi:glycosyltransferase [Leptolyngbya sp. FACHB-711]|uniref:glycosyltransferase n=1 Tax=unclassified Leptolyngbya TaxID=2650499 RepID=UPI001689EEA7|nr:glycosyltransferase [Leptolyngbya sp. FACHB-711]MBD1848808.1 glycosyltransferase family 1 protein [Cyanobacteria bacterium FACHB-502]MBD2027153.1 glycosyltransferase family 1 protein [Leptolyngbya sp. FACHB-711]
MNLFVLSELNPACKHVGWSVAHSLESTLRSVCDPTFIYPFFNTCVRLFDHSKVPDNGGHLLWRWRHRLFKSWYKVGELPPLPPGRNVLIVVGMNPRFMLSVHALDSVLKQFDLCLGYILDGFNPQHFDFTLADKFDHLFVIGSELAEDVERLRGVSASFLPLATNVLEPELNLQHRSIDLLSYGRRNPEAHQRLYAHFNQPGSDRFYYHSTFSEPDVYNLEEHATLLKNLLNRAKVSLCFEASDKSRFMGYSPILYRWFEAWAAGCTVVGKKPTGRGVAELMQWENSAIELPDAPTEWIPFIEDVLADEATLQRNAERNYREALLQHDWRYRIREMLNRVGLETPEKLEDQIKQLRCTAYGMLASVQMSA